MVGLTKEKLPTQSATPCMGSEKDCSRVPIRDLDQAPVAVQLYKRFLWNDRFFSSCVCCAIFEFRKHGPKHHMLEAKNLKVSRL